MYKPGDAYYKEFVTSSPATGAAVNADSLPVATANHNGADDSGFALTVTNVDTGRYKITGTVPGGYAKGDVFNVSVAATVGGVAGKAVVDTQQIDSKRIGDLNDSPYNGGAVASVTAPVTVGTNNDKTGYGLSSAERTALSSVILTDTTDTLGAAILSIKTQTDKLSFDGSGNVKSAPQTTVTLAAAGLDGITIESGVNMRQALSPILAACAGVLSGAGTGTVVIKNPAGNTTRITATTDASGDRSAVTLNLP
jgi:hypothetical protein